MAAHQAFLAKRKTLNVQKNEVQDAILALAVGICKNDETIFEKAQSKLDDLQFERGNNSDVNATLRKAYYLSHKKTLSEIQEMIVSE